jgi:hypothetical protein
MVTRTRHGMGQVGCLVTLMILSAIGYFGLGVGQVYWNYYEYRDRMQQEARFAGSRSDNVIKRRIALFGDSLGLPEGAKHVRVRRSGKHVYIWAEYYETIELPFISKELLLAPRAEWTY